jgi:hypothetical protein
VNPQPLVAGDEMKKRITTALLLVALTISTTHAENTGTPYLLMPDGTATGA